MTSITTKPDSSQPATETAAHLFDNWFDPIEAGLRDRVHEFLHAMFEGELDLLDRLTHHVHILEMNGDSYRLKQSKRCSRNATADNHQADAAQA